MPNLNALVCLKQIDIYPIFKKVYELWAQDDPGVLSLSIPSIYFGRFRSTISRCFGRYATFTYLHPIYYNYLLPDPLNVYILLLPKLFHLLSSFLQRMVLAVPCPVCPPFNTVDCMPGPSLKLTLNLMTLTSRRMVTWSDTKGQGQRSRPP